MHMPTFQLFDEQGRRLYLTPEERTALLDAAQREAGTMRTFCGVLHYTGCTLKEAATLTAGQVDFDARTIVLNGAAFRRHDINRAVPVPDALVALLDEMHSIRSATAPMPPDARLWRHHAATMSDRVSTIMKKAGIAQGPHATLWGIRYGFLIHAIRCGIILTRIEKWMGYSRTSDNGHYVEQLALHDPDIIGIADERTDASLMW
jgi:integrase/recombinase XerD